MIKPRTPVVCHFGAADIEFREGIIMDWLSIRYPISTSDVESVEKEFDLRLPLDYKKVIGPINGGALRNAWVEVPGLGRVSFSRNVSLQKGASAGIYELLPIFNDGPIHIFPFASVGNGDYFCFDLKNNTVVLYRHELQTTAYVCDTFSQFLEKIKAD